MHEPVITDFRTKRVDEAFEHLSASFGRHSRLSVSDSPFVYQFARIDLGDVRIDILDSTLESDYRVEPLGYPLVARVLSGRFESVTEGVERRVGPGDIFLAARPHMDYLSRLRATHVQLVTVAPQLIAQLAPDVGSRLRRLTFEPIDQLRARSWNRVIGYLTDSALDEDAAVSPLVLGEAGRLAASMLLALFDPVEYVDRPADRRDAGQSTLRRAIAYLETNPDLDIGVADIARACSVSVRSVQLAFRRELDMTPTAYLRRIRLDRVHHDLVAADPDSGETVTRIGLRWGFARSSRLSAQYREVYGKSP